MIKLICEHILSRVSVVDSLVTFHGPHCILFLCVFVGCLHRPHYAELLVARRPQSGLLVGPDAASGFPASLEPTWAQGPQCEGAAQAVAFIF